MSIPTVRLTPPDSQGKDNARESKGLSHQIDAALSEIGFVGLTGTGMPAALVDAAFTHARAFFERSESDKANYAYGSASENFGFQGLQQEHLNPTKPADVKETFTMRNIGRYTADDPRWPSQAFYHCMHQFHAAALAVVQRLEQPLANFLGIADDFFTERHTGENISLRLLHYPATNEAELLADQMGAGEHTDYGLLSLLFQHRVGGLQVLNRNQQWVSVDYERDLVVVNAGDLLERWTNGRYPSTRHRVPAQTGDQDRYSIALFVDPDSAVEVSPLASCIDSERPQRYAPTTAGAHIQEKITASHRAQLDS